MFRDSGEVDDGAGDALAPLDGRIGEGWGGEGVLGCHVNVVVAVQGSPTAAAAATVLASPRPGHVPFLVCAGAGTVVRPATVFVNKTTLDGPGIERLTWGAAQIGVARGVLDAVHDGTVPVHAAHRLVLLVACWLDPAAGRGTVDEGVETAVCGAARTAVLAALHDAVRATPHQVRHDAVAALVTARERITNGFYGGQ